MGLGQGGKDGGAPGGVISWCFGLLILVMIGGWVAVAVGSHAGVDGVGQAPWLLVVLAVIWLAWLGIVGWAQRGATDESRLLSNGGSVPNGGLLSNNGLMWGLALGLRGVCFFAWPVFENDWVRYLWDGWIFVQHGSPYDRVPLDAFHDPGAQELFGAALDQFGYPEIATIYGPVAMVVFAIGALLAPANIWVLKALFVACELLALLGLRRLLSPRAWLALALCPLLLFEVWVNMHVDAVALAAAVWGLVFLHRGLAAHDPMVDRSGLSLPWRAAILAGVCLGLAVACRLHALPLVAVVLWWYRAWRLLPALLATVALSYAPFVLTGSAAGLDVSQSFLAQWWYNAFVLQAVGWLIDTISGGTVPLFWARWLLLGVAGLVLLYWFFLGPLQRPALSKVEPLGTSQGTSVQRRYPLVPADWLYGALLLSGPVLNPWYALWLLPFAVARWQGWTLAVILIATVGYANLGNLGMYTGENYTTPFDHPWWVPAVQWMFFLLGIVLSIVFRATGRPEFMLPVPSRAEDGRTL